MIEISEQVVDVLQVEIDRREIDVVVSSFGQAEIDIVVSSLGRTGPEGPPGPPGPEGVGSPGPIGPPGSAPYEHVQSILSDEWTIDHNIGFRPVVTVTDNAGTVVYGSMSHDTINRVVLRFGVPFIGKAYLTR